MQPERSNQIQDWANGRLKIYNGSLRHFFKSLVLCKTTQEGFLLFARNGLTLDPTKLFIASIPNYYKILFPDTLVVKYNSQSGETQLSKLVVHGSVQVSDEGVLLIPGNLDVEGQMKSIGMISLLPLDYKPILPEIETFGRFYEKLYVHTDKPYYYPGEPLWFKGYSYYEAPAWRDSLSKVLYVELIGPKKSVILSKTLKMDSGFFHNDFILPDTLKAGVYYLRAYTNLNRNFGDDKLFVKPLHVLNSNERVELSEEVSEQSIVNKLLIIRSLKNQYKPREKITIQLATKDTTDRPTTSNLSVSVTDAVQVVPIRETTTIIQRYQRTNEKYMGGMEFKYPVEFGISFSGQFKNDKGQPERTGLSIIEVGRGNIILAETNDTGQFWQTRLQFFDTTSFSFKSDKAKDLAYGKVELKKREPPAMSFPEYTDKIITRLMDSPQRIISEYEVPKGTKLLDALEVKGKRIKVDETETANYRVSRPYGKPDYVLTSKDINTGYGNLAYSLVGKVPGLIVRPESGSIGYSRSGGQSLNFQGGPLVTLNDAPLGGDAYTNISMINPATIESIEFTKRINVLYGSLGAAGVIAIYTKTGTSKDVSSSGTNFQTIKIMGYSNARRFNYLDYEDPNIDASKPDYRSTIYWNPSVWTDTKTGLATISFFAADLPGRYRIVIEGFTHQGLPVRGVFFVDIDNL